MESNQGGTGNAALGYYALQANSTGSNNVAIGYKAGSSITTGDYNISIGSNAQVPSATTNNQAVIGNSSIDFFMPGQDGAYLGNGTNNWTYRGKFETVANDDTEKTISERTGVFVFTSGGTQSVTLNGPPSGATGQVLIVKNNSGYDTTGLVVTNGGTQTFIYDGSNWI